MMPSESKTCLAAIPRNAFTAESRQEEYSIVKRIDIDFFEPFTSQETDSWSVPVVRKESEIQDGTVGEQPAVDEELWLMAGRSRYCPGSGVCVRINPLAI